MQGAPTEADRLRDLPVREAQILCRDRATRGGEDLAALEKALVESAVASDRVWGLLLRCYRDPESGFREVVRQLVDAGTMGLTGWDRGWSSGWLPSLVARRILTAPDLVPPHRRDPEGLDARESVLWLRVLAEATSLLAEDRAFLRSAIDDPDLEVWPHAARAWGRNALHDAELRGEMLDEVTALLRQGRIEFPSASRKRRARAIFVSFCAFLSASPLPAEPGEPSPPEPPFEALPPWVQGIIRGHSLDFFPARLSDDLDLAAVLHGSDCLLEVEVYRPRLRERLSTLVGFLQKRSYPISTEMVGSLLARAVRAGHLDATGVTMLVQIATAWGKMKRTRASDLLSGFLVFEHLARCLAEMAHGETRAAALDAIVGLAGAFPSAVEVSRTAVWQALWAAAATGDLTPRAKDWLARHAMRGLDVVPTGAVLAAAETFEFVLTQRWIANRVDPAALARAGMEAGPGEGSWVGPIWRETVATLLSGLQHAAAWGLLGPQERVLWVWRLCHLFEEGVIHPSVQIGDVMYLIGQAPSPGTEEYGASDTRAQLLLELFLRASELEGEAFSALTRIARLPRSASFDAALHVIAAGPSPFLEPSLALDLRRHFRRIRGDLDATLRDLCRLAARGARHQLFELVAEALHDGARASADLARSVGEGVQRASDPRAIEATESRISQIIGGHTGPFLDAWRRVREAWHALGSLTWEDPQADLVPLERAVSAVATLAAALRDDGASPPAWTSAGFLASARDRLGTVMPVDPADIPGVEARWRTVADALLELRRGIAEALPPLERAGWEAATSSWSERLGTRCAKAASLEAEWRACQPNAMRDAEAVGRLAAAAKGLLPTERADRLLAAIAEQWMQEVSASTSPGDAAERLLATASTLVTATQRHVLVWVALCSAMERGGEADVRAWFARLDAPTHAERKRVAHWWLDRYDFPEARRVLPDLARVWPLHHAPTLLGVLVGYLGMVACGSVWAQIAAAGGYVQLAVILIGSLAAAALCVVWDLQERGVVPKGLPSTTALAEGFARAAPLLGIAAGEAFLLNLAGQLLLASTQFGWRDVTWAGALPLVLTTSSVTLFLGLFVAAATFRRAAIRSGRA